ncbi:MAG: hypothetical protein AB1679_01340 [Actinomycetota bacterium]|jgi:CBS domain-containing protein
MHVRDLYRKPTVTVGADATLADAAALMNKEAVGAVEVIMHAMATSTTRGWRHLERYAYVERDYDEVWSWLAGHLSSLGDPLPGGGRSVELRIRPGGVKVSRPVRLRVHGFIGGDQRARAALGWADAAHPRAFPELEAELEIVRVPHDGAPFTQLGILARYRPPLGPLGALGDRLAGAEVVDASLTTFLDELAEAVGNHVTPPLLAAQAEDSASGEHDDNPNNRRLFLTVDGLAVRRGGAAGVCETLAALPGVARVSLNPFSGLAAVDHDPTRCGLEQMAAALDEEAAGRPPA